VHAKHLSDEQLEAHRKATNHQLELLSQVQAQRQEQRKAKTDLQDKLQSTTAALSGQQMEKEATQESRKSETAALSKIEAEAAQAKDEAAQAKDDRIFKLMMKRKELKAAGYSVIEIDKHLPFPQQDDNERSNKRRWRVIKKEEET
jgi:hypothetical protein